MNEVNNEISNEEFNKACKNLDNIKIMQKAVSTSGVTRMMSKEELESCKLMAMWRTLQFWSKKAFPNVKFTTFLFKNVRWQCYYQASKISKYRQNYAQLIDHMEYIQEREMKKEISLEDKLSLEEALKGVSNSTLDLIDQRFHKNMTFKEIGKTNGYCHETARKKAKRAVENIKRLYE